MIKHLKLHTNTYFIRLVYTIFLFDIFNWQLKISRSHLVSVKNNHFKIPKTQLINHSLELIMNTESNENKLITLTQASYILGYKSYRSINKLINEGYLRTFNLPDTTRKRVNFTDVMNLATPDKANKNTH